LNINTISKAKSKAGTVAYNDADKLDLKNLKYMTDDKINKFSTGYENNNYLLLSVINDRYEVFEFLLNEKKIDVTFRNSNGWNVLHYIIKYQRFSKLFLI
jgi:ankyrin repeat protein